MTFDLDTFKAKRPWRDLTFWVAALTSLAMLLPLLDDAWRSAKFPTGAQLGAAVAPLTAWLILHGVVRAAGAQAAGQAAAAMAPELARQELVYGQSAPVGLPVDPLAGAEAWLDDADLAEAQVAHAQQAAEQLGQDPAAAVAVMENADGEEYVLHVGDEAPLGYTLKSVVS